ncbi:MAG: hypothetical protein A2667_02930 [Candidatus Wildermuthbacteria bacterium RIFCSPHIGHO2_01_FULL_47_27]|nr:MAG: hypothetical protein A2667_02930 [Candidatus Wildermuthbacteria bacterium RIFCSPHIGHO2_01_FULL_47_27]OHA76544.1 MAG: hypothetical protein A3I38_03685 [Candidatus Wildermuthbacteria bacterium RIFCSPLOWO2_02_FULL_47_10]
MGAQLWKALPGATGFRNGFVVRDDFNAVSRERVSASIHKSYENVWPVSQHKFTFDRVVDIKIEVMHEAVAYLTFLHAFLESFPGNTYRYSMPHHCFTPPAYILAYCFNIVK